MQKKKRKVRKQAQENSGFDASNDQEIGQEHVIQNHPSPSNAYNAPSTSMSAYAFPELPTVGLTSLEPSFDPLPNARIQEHRPIQQYDSDFESIPPTPRTISVTSIRDAVKENKASKSPLGNTVSTPFCAAPPPIQHTFEEPNYGLKRPKTPRSHGRVDM